jgi:hypothetical protein
MAHKSDQVGARVGAIQSMDESEVRHLLVI